MKIGVLVLFIFLFASVTSAASLDAFADLSQILTRAMLTDLIVQSHEHKVLAAKGNQAVLASYLKPQWVVSGESKEENVANNPMLGIRPGARQEDRIQSSLVGLSIGYQLGGTPTFELAMEKTELALELAQSQKQEAIATVVYQTQEAYYLFLRSFLGREIAKEALELETRQLLIIRQRLDEGTASALELLQQQNKVLEAQNRLGALEARFQLASLRFHLALALEQDKEPDEWAKVMLEKEMQPVLRWDISLEEALVYGLGNHRALGLMEKQVELVRLEYQESVMARDWSLSLAGRYVKDNLVFQGSLNSDLLLKGTVARSFQDRYEVNLDFSDEDIPDWAKEFLEEWQSTMNQESTNPWQVTLGLTWRFGDGGARSLQSESRSHVLMANEKQLESVYSFAKLEIQSRFVQMDIAYGTYELAERMVEEAEGMLLQLIRLHDLGSLTQKELDQGRLYYRIAEQRMLEAKWEYLLEQTRLAITLGLSAPELLSLIEKSHSKER